MSSSGPAQTRTTPSLSSSAVCTSSSLYAAVGSVMERPVKAPETDSGENKKVFERLFVQLSKETGEVGLVVYVISEVIKSGCDHACLIFLVFLASLASLEVDLPADSAR